MSWVVPNADEAVLDCTLISTVSPFFFPLLLHYQLPCRGRDEVPDEETVNTFVFAVSEFLQYAPREKKTYILVHCTHGHNRTGYMIVNFLMRHNGGYVAQVRGVKRRGAEGRIGRKGEGEGEEDLHPGALHARPQPHGVHDCKLPHEAQRRARGTGKGREGESSRGLCMRFTFPPSQFLRIGRE